jgi:serine protease Do
MELRARRHPSTPPPASRSGSGHMLLRMALALSLLAMLSLPQAARAETPPAKPASAPAGDDASGRAPAFTAEQAQSMERAARTVLGVQATAVEGARSAASLGRQREGSGIVISADGLVLTIGYLILEAETVSLTTHDGKRVPARVVAYDLATGFGLVQALAPLGIAPAALGGRTPTPGAFEPLLVASGGRASVWSLAQLVSRRPFSGYWEYHIDGALFTIPARRDHSGAGLFNTQGELLGVGSLFVSDPAAPGQPGRPGNMFVPVELLPPILGELRQRGSSSASTRAWLGISCVERDDAVLVLRVNDDSPAEVAGLSAGDRITAIDGQPVSSLAMLWKTLWAGGAAERNVTLDIQRKGQAQRLVVHAVDRAKTLRRPEGI